MQLYLKDTTTSGLHIFHNSDCRLSMYADADWAGYPDDRISTSGYVFFCGRNLVSWWLKKTNCSSVIYWSWIQISCKFPFRTNMRVQLAQWIVYHHSKYPYNVLWQCWCHLSLHNPMCHIRMQHIVVDLIYVRNHVQAHRVLVRHTHACDQTADTFTKPVLAPTFARCSSKLGVIDPHLTWEAILRMVILSYNKLLL